MNNITQKINKRIRKDGKLRYGMVSNSLYMVKFAWNVEKSVIVICLISVFLAIALNLLQLFILPTILKMWKKLLA